MAVTKEKLENGLYKIEAGETVADFLECINYNFDKIKSWSDQKQKTITIRTNAPDPEDGEDGDICIVYEAPTSTTTD